VVPGQLPGAAGGLHRRAIEYSLAGRLGHLLAVVFEPIGFNWQISIALVPGMAAREVLVSSLGTVYALGATAEDAASALVPLIAGSWSLATALSLLAWFVFAPQCLSTLAAVRREASLGMAAATAAYLVCAGLRRLVRDLSPGRFSCAAGAPISPARLPRGPIPARPPTRKPLHARRHVRP
jgi:Fe2+ transport system protein B